MFADKPTELSRIKLKNLNSAARPYDQRAFSPLDPTAVWLSHLALAIYMFVVVNFDVLAQGSDFRIERRQVVFLCWMQDSNPRSQTPNRQQTEYSLTNRLSTLFRQFWNFSEMKRKSSLVFWGCKYTIYKLAVKCLSLYMHRVKYHTTKYGWLRCFRRVNCNMCKSNQLWFTIKCQHFHTDIYIKLKCFKWRI